LLHFARNRLSPASIRTFMCLGSWSRHNLVDNQDVVKAVMKKRKRNEKVE
ncbi:hypothetical protein PAXINDRAFT_77928, partial [Paxillus involutus ATCC 200175]